MQACSAIGGRPLVRIVPTIRYPLVRITQHTVQSKRIFGRFFDWRSRRMTVITGLTLPIPHDLILDLRAMPTKSLAG